MTARTSTLLVAMFALLSVAQPLPGEPAAQKNTAPKAKITLKVAGKMGYETVLKKHRGKVVLVDFWATWCVPCRKGFPQTVELFHKYRKKGLRVISVSLDDPDDDGTHPGALKFLKGQKAAFDNLISRDGTDEASFEAFQIRGGIPHYKLYDRRGKVIGTFSNEDPKKKFDHKHIENAVKKALRVE